MKWTRLKGDEICQLKRSAVTVDDSNSSTEPETGYLEFWESTDNHWRSHLPEIVFPPWSRWQRRASRLTLCALADGRAHPANDSTHIHTSGLDSFKSTHHSLTETTSMTLLEWASQNASRPGWHFSFLNFREKKTDLSCCTWLPCWSAPALQNVR